MSNQGGSSSSSSSSAGAGCQPTRSAALRNGFNLLGAGRRANTRRRAGYNDAFSLLREAGRREEMRCEYVRKVKSQLEGIRERNPRRGRFIDPLAVCTSALGRFLQ